MTNCEFHREGASWVCRRCGRAVPFVEGSTPAATCRPLPPIGERARHYARAVVRHAAGGLQTRTDAEVAERLAICQACERFNQKRQACSICGCRCHNGRNALTNKLRMAAERCPLGKWN